MRTLAIITRICVIGYLVFLTSVGLLFLPGQFSRQHLDPDRGANAVLLVLGCLIAVTNLLSTFAKTRSFLPIALILDAVTAVVCGTNFIPAVRGGDPLTYADFAVGLLITGGHMAAALSLVYLRFKKPRSTVEAVFE